jgi:hypothetical protein
MMYAPGLHAEWQLDLQAEGRDDGMFKGEALGLRAMYGA